MTPVVGSCASYQGPGVYAHFKENDLYYVLALSKNCNTGVVSVVYRQMYAADDGWGGLMDRALEEFNHVVRWSDRDVPRFRRCTLMGVGGI